MSDSKKVIFFLGHNNDVDQIIPIIYKIAERGNVPVEVILWRNDDVDESDYRVELVKNKDKVTIHSFEMDNSKRKPISKHTGGEILGNILERIYTTITDSDSGNSTSIGEVIDGFARGYDNVVLCVDWIIAGFYKGSLSKYKNKDGFVTVVLPHGDEPFYNAVEQQELHFEKLINTEEAFVKPLNLFKVVHETALLGMASSFYDYYVMPNQATARRSEPFIEEEKIKILGSPRYNQEWLEVLSGHRPKPQLPSDNDLKVVMFNRSNEKYNVSEIEAENTIRLVTQFPNVHLIVKEHPRFSLIDPSPELAEIPNLEIKKDEVQSTSLIDWGDVFLELGTTISFEPIMRNKPVLSLSYTHSNYTTVSHYLTGSDMRCKDDLYYALHDLIDEGYSDFYDEEERDRFIREMITSGHDSVLDAHADFILSCLDVNKDEA